MENTKREHILLRIGQNIRSYRKQKHLTLYELSEKLNISHVTIQKYETGKIEPNITMLLEIANALDVQLSDLLNIDVNIKVTIPENKIKNELDDINEKLSFLLANFHINIPNTSDTGTTIKKLNQLLELIGCQIVIINNQTFLKTSEKDLAISGEDIRSMYNSITEYLNFSVTSFKNKYN
ncbi:helix-turn-helix transcriptional regulator [Peptoniphilus equinus]|uniref:Helix-turn-helix transcriptional regulator n=1 Tax=Peptoniphilus equinus TaxID=3016343 RepID=A0ABY7QSN1_9FIRM|nr:helix-turn-helix transcriptional regulator [Peptoniphilus equinus]WBW49305.1 helix-turn-helix transcriptional regulator [Peptoniphilus equinus]